MSKKLIAAAGGVAAAVALAVPGQANAEPLLKVKTQVLQPQTGCSLLGTQGSFLLGSELNICITKS